MKEIVHLSFVRALFILAFASTFHVHGEETTRQIRLGEKLLWRAADQSRTERLAKGWGALIGGPASGIGLFAAVRAANREKWRNPGNLGLGLVTISGGIALGLTGVLTSIYQFTSESAPEKYRLDYANLVKTSASSIERLSLLEEALSKSAEVQKKGRYFWGGIYAAAGITSVAYALSTKQIDKPLYSTWLGVGVLLAGLSLWNFASPSYSEDALAEYQNGVDKEESKQRLTLENLSLTASPDSQSNQALGLSVSFEF